MAQWLRTQVVLVEDQSAISSTYVRRLTRLHVIQHPLQSQKYIALSWFLFVCMHIIYLFNLKLFNGFNLIFFSPCALKKTRKTFTRA